jgi:hypothetical protein
MGLCPECDRPVGEGRRWCAVCLPPRAVIGDQEWRRRYARLRRAAAFRPAPGSARGHLDAFHRTLEAVEPGAGSDALVAYGESLARVLDDRPTAAVGREYRLTVALLFDLGVEPEDPDEVAARAELVRLLSTPTGGSGSHG